MALTTAARRMASVLEFVLFPDGSLTGSADRAAMVEQYGYVTASAVEAETSRFVLSFGRAAGFDVGVKTASRFVVAIG